MFKGFLLDFVDQLSFSTSLSLTEKSSASKFFEISRVQSAKLRSVESPRGGERNYYTLAM